MHGLHGCSRFVCVVSGAGQALQLCVRTRQCLTIRAARPACPNATWINPLDA